MKHTVTIIYKSGAKVHVECDSFTATRGISVGLKEVKWEKIRPNPLYFGVDNVESIWEGKV